MTNQNVYRASSLPMAFRCGGSVHLDPDGIAVDTASGAAGMGTAVHAVLAALVSSGLDELPDLRPYADRYGVESMDELAVLSSFGRRAWMELRQTLPADVPAMTEVHFADEHVSGHADVYAPFMYALDRNSALVIDWKSGRLDMDHYHQMAAYAYLAMMDANAATVTAAVVLLREQSYRIYKFTRLELMAWHDELVAQVVNWDGTFRVGEHCRFCRRQGTCPARAAMVQGAIAELLAPELADAQPGPLTISPERIVDLYRRSRVVKAAVEAFEELVRSHIMFAGPVKTPEGHSLELVAMHRDRIDPLKGWPIISRQLDDTEIAGAITIGKGALLEAVANKAPARAKGKAKAAMLDELRAAGAIETREFFSLREVRGDHAKLPASPVTQETAQ